MPVPPIASRTRRWFAITAAAAGSLALLLFWLSNPNDSRQLLSDENVPESASAHSNRDSLPDRASHSEPAAPDDASALTLHTPLVIGTSPPSFESKQRSNAAAFAAEALDPEWRSQKWKELSENLTVIAPELKSAQIDCRSTMCTVELVSVTAETPQEQARRMQVWGEEVKKSGFVRMDTEFFVDGTTSLSYLSTRRVAPAAALPPEFPPEVAESFRQAMRHEGLGQSTEGGQATSPGTWTGKRP